MRSRSRVRWLAAAAALVILVAVLAIQHYATTDRRSAPPPSGPTVGPTAGPPGSSTTTPSTGESSGSPTGLPTAPPTASVTGGSSSTTPPAPRRTTQPPPPPATTPLTTTGSPVTAALANWDVVAYLWSGLGTDPAALVRYRASTGETISTPVPDPDDMVAPILAADASSARVIIPTEGRIYSVTGSTVTPSPADLGDATWILPGHDPSHLWLIRENPAAGYSLVSVDTTDGSSGSALAVDEGFTSQIDGFIAPDGNGNVLAQDPRGTYVIGADGAQRITTRHAIAIGPTVLLTSSCDEDGTCEWAAVDRATGRTTTTFSAPTGAPPYGRGFPYGVVSPDGHYAALQNSTPGGAIDLFGLDTGITRTLDVNPPPTWNGTVVNVAFTPDGRFLLAPAASTIQVIDVTTGTIAAELPIARARAFVVVPAD